MVLVRREVPVGRLPPGHGRSSAGASVPSAAPQSTYESVSQVRGPALEDLAEDLAGQGKDYRTARMQLTLLEQQNKERLEISSLAREKGTNQSRSDPPTQQPWEGSVPQGYATQTRSLEGQKNKPLVTASVPGLEMGSAGSSQQDYRMRQKALEQQIQTSDYVSQEQLKRLQQDNVKRWKAMRAADPNAFDANQPGVRAERIRQVEGCYFQDPEMNDHYDQGPTDRPRCNCEPPNSDDRS